MRPPERRQPADRAAPAAAAVAVAALMLGVPLLAGIGTTGGGPGPDVLPNRSPSAVITRDSVAPTMPADTAGEGYPGSNRVTITGYRSSGHTVTVAYSVGAADCSAGVTVGEVRETASSVAIWLRRRAASNADSDCPRVLLLDTVRIRLSAPLDDRVVKDGARGGALVPISPDRGTS